MLFPKKVKHRKWQRARKDMTKVSPETRGITLSYGSYGLKAMTGAEIESKHIESARKVITRYVAKFGRYWIRIFPDRPITQKAAEVPMGKGKGDPQGFCFEVRPGRILFEVDGLSRVEAHEALRKAGAKLPVKTKVVARAHE